MSRDRTSQNVNVTGSSGVSFGDITQNAGGAGRREGRPSPPVRVLFLAANPAETSRLRLDREARAIDEALRGSGLRDRFELEQSWAVSDTGLQDALLRYEPAVVHLSGHGSRSGRLLLEQGPAARDMAVVHPLAQPAAASGPGSETAVMQAMSRLFAPVRGTTRCVVLNACHSAAQAAAIAEQVDCAIGMAGAIEDEAAIRFSIAFYCALGYGQSVQGAFDLACAQSILAAAGSEGVPHLFASRARPDGLVLVRHD